MEFMEALRQVGSFGRFQLILLLVACPLTQIFGSFSYWIQIMILLVPDHQCIADSNGTNQSVQCGLHRPLVDEALATFREAPGADSPFLHAPLPILNESWIPCSNGWQYDLLNLHPTVVSEFDWVCEKSWKIFASHSIYWAGSMFGYFVSGFAVDRYGRWLTVLVLTLILTCGFVGTLFPLNFLTFVVARFVAGTSAMPLQTITYALIMEYVEPTKRKLTAVVAVFSFLATATVVPWIAFWLQDWRHLTAFGLLPSLPLFFVIFKYIPESASWQLVRGDPSSAVATLKRIGQMNGRPLSEDMLAKLTVALDIPSPARCSTFGLVGTPNMRKKTICLFIAWMMVCMSYHGNNLNQANLPASVYMIYSLGAFLEMPALLLHLLSVDRVGRRPPVVTALLCVGVIGPLLAFFPPASPWAAFFLGLLVRTILSLAYNVLHQLGTELFPTCIRGRGLCLMRSCGDLANCLGPFLVSLASVDLIIPQVVFSSLALLATMLVLSLPETLNQDLPQTLDDGENFGRDQTCCAALSLLRLSSAEAKSKYDVSKRHGSCKQKELVDVEKEATLRNCSDWI